MLVRCRHIIREKVDLNQRVDRWIQSKLQSVTGNVLHLLNTTHRLWKMLKRHQSIDVLSQEI